MSSSSTSSVSSISNTDDEVKEALDLLKDWSDSSENKKSTTEDVAKKNYPDNKELKDDDSTINEFNLKNRTFSSSSSSSSSSSNLSSVGSFFDEDPRRPHKDADDQGLNQRHIDGEVNNNDVTDKNETGSELPLLQLVTRKTFTSEEHSPDNTKALKNTDDNSSSSSDTSDVEDDTSESSSSGENSDANNNEANESFKEEKPLQRPTSRPIRPQTAKPPRQSRGDTKLNSVKDPPQRRRGYRISIRSTSGSSMSSGASVEKHNKFTKRQALSEEELMRREIALHRFLDEQLASQLDKHRTYFDRGYTVAPRSQRYAKRTPASVQRRRTVPRRTRKMDTQRVHSVPTPRVREEDVRRNIYHLVSQLAQHESLENLVKTSKRTHLQGRKPSNHKRVNDSESDQTTTNVEEYAVGNEKHSSKEPQQVGSNDEEESNGNSNWRQKSILKKKGKQGHPQKHVQLEDTKTEENIPRFSKDLPSNQKFHPNTTRATLMSLLSSISPVDYVMTDNYGQMHRVTLRHTPINSKSPRNNRRSPAVQHRAKRKSREGSRKKKSKEVMSDAEKTNDESENGKSSTTKGRIETEYEGTGINDQNTEKSTPRIRPGTEPIKCNWKPESSESSQPELKFSDHQLKNSANPAVLEWLSRKNSLQRRNRIHKSRENKSKRDRLIQEQNEKEDKQANALIEYEKWKKKKNREILLRRRREGLTMRTSNSEMKQVSFESGKAAPIPPDPKESTMTTFSDLRSSAITPHPPNLAPPSVQVLVNGRRRPKSAPTKVSFDNSDTKTSLLSEQNFVPVAINYQNGDVTILPPHNGSDVTNLSRRGEKQGQKKRSFMSDLLEEKSSPPSMFDVPPPGTFPKQSSEKVEKPTSDTEKDHYNNWVRSKGASSPYQIKYNRKKKKTKASPSPTHDPLTNEMLSNLAKRRIKKILDQKKRVDSGLPKKPDKSESTEGEKDGSDVATRWRLKETPTVNLDLQNVAKTRRKKGNDRPMFSYNRKNKSKSVFHERNPVVSQALNT